MPAPYELSTWVFPPGNSKRPVVVKDQEVRIYLRAVAEDGTPGTPTGLRLEVRRPDGTIQVITGGDILAGEEPGTFYARVQADQNRLWRYEWIHTGPVEGHMNGTFTVQAGTVQPPGPGQPVLATEDLDPLATEGGGLLRVKRIPALPTASGIAGLEVVGAQAGETKKARLDTAIGTYVIQGVGVPIADYAHGTTVLPDDTTKITNGIAVARLFGFMRVATIGVVVGILGTVTNIKGTVLTNSVGIDVQDAVGNTSGYHRLPHWQLGPNAKITGTGGAMRVEDFIAIGAAWTPVVPGTDPVLDNRAQRDALTHQIRGYAGACLEWEGDGNAVIRSTLLGFIRPWDFTRGGRHHWDSVIIDVGGTMQQYGVGFRLTRSGGAARGRAVHVVTLGIKNVTGVNAVDHQILAAEQVTSGPHTGKTRVRIGFCFFLKYKVWKPGRQVSKGDIRVVNYSLDPLNINLHAFEVKRRGDWVTGPTAPGTGTTLTEGDIGATFSDGATDWTYVGPYTGIRFDANRPAAYLLDKDTNPAGAWGHRVTVSVPPGVLYDEAILDPRLRGHYEVLARGSQALDQAEWILDLPWQAHFATALPAGGFLAIHPGMRIAKGIETDTSDGGYFDGWTCKGPIIWGDLSLSNAVMVDGSGEAPTEGESGRDSPNYLGWYLGKGAAGMVLIGGGNKNVGTPLIIDTGSDQPVEFVAKENSGGETQGIWVRSGALRVSGGHIRGFSMRIRVDEDGFADLSGLSTDAGLEIIGEGWEKRVIMPRVGVTGPALGRQVIAGPARIEIGETLATPAWAPLTTVTAGLRRKVRGIQGDLWRLRCTVPGTTDATAPEIMRAKKLRENGVAYGLGKDLWLTGSDGNAHLVQVSAVAGAGLSGGSPPAMTDVTVTIADGDLTMRRLGRYTGPGAVVPDGSAVWAIEDLDLGVRARISVDPETGVGELASFTGGGNRNVRLRWSETLGLEVDGLYHIGAARYLFTPQGHLSLGSRTTAQLPAGAAGENPIVHHSDDDRLLYRIGTGAWQGLRNDGPRLKATSVGTTPVRLTTDGAAISGDRSNIGPTVASGSHLRVELLVRLARTSGSGAAGDFAEWDVTLTLDRPGNANSTRVTGAPTGAAPSRTQGLGAATLTITADTTADAGNRNGLNVSVGGVSGVTASLLAWSDIRG